MENENIKAKSGEKYSNQFISVVFTNDCFIGDSVIADQDFTAGLKRLAGYALQCNLKIWVTSSLRSLDNQVQGVIVPPATNSCHHIGHAIDMNLLHDEILFNSKALAKESHSSLPDAVINFLALIREDAKLRWGGDFNTEDPVHIDDNFFNDHKTIYQAKLEDRLRQLNA
ncbi:MAG: M15 family metallopeptidase [Desulfobacteraceae bacterium]|nr:M15 family metallopeptidase [Desulfobacteraceae bacterium]